MYKEKIVKKIDEIKDELIEISDYIYDNPETLFNEKKSSEILIGLLKKYGFEVESPLGSLDTAFRAKIKSSEKKYKVGLLCEYDALPMGHGCGHHMQGPAIIGAAIALRELELPFELIVYGTPAEEGGGGKLIMLNEGYIKELDLALMMHGGPNTQVDVKSMAMSTQIVEFFGKSAHAALAPYEGRSALDALLLSFNGIEFLREHVKEDSRMHYTILETPGAANVVPDHAIGEFSLRSYNSKYLDKMLDRFYDIIKGASLMTGTNYEIREKKRLESKIPSYILNDLLMQNARNLNARSIAPAREKTGSSDFGNVTYIMPGSCIRVSFVPEGSVAHSQTYLDYGKTEDAHDCVIMGAKILATTIIDLCEDGIIEKIKTEFNDIKDKM